jgi:type III secretion protein C
VVRDLPERLAAYDQLIASLDVEPQMIEIEASIIDVNLDRLQELGINWRWENGRNAVLFGTGTESDLRLRPGLDITPSGRGGFISTVLGNGNQLVARINALASDGAARVVSRPQIITLSNVEAIFNNSSTFYVRVQGFQEVDLFNVSSGTSLRVTPHVFRDRNETRIKLLVNVEDGKVSDERVDQIPVVENSAINTQALIFEGESLLIGGLTRESSKKTTSKVPLLGDIPVVGNLFKSTTDRNIRTERMFLITPRIVSANRAAPGKQTPDPTNLPNPPIPVVPPLEQGKDNGQAIRPVTSSVGDQRSDKTNRGPLSDFYP